MGFNFFHWVSHAVNGAVHGVEKDLHLPGGLQGIVHAAQAQLPPNLAGPFNQAVGALQNPAGALSSVQGFIAQRNLLKGDALKAFDMAASMLGGLSQGPAGIPQGLSPQALAGYLMTHGMQGAPPANNAAIMSTVAAAPEARAGAAVAVKEIAAAREGWWPKFLRGIGLKK